MELSRITFWTAAVRRSLGAYIFTLAAALSITAQSKAQIPCRYEITHIIQGPYSPTLGYPATIGTAISPSGHYVCGWYRYLINNYAFLYDTKTEQFTTLPYTASNLTFANDVNDEFVVGQAQGLGFVYRIATGQSTILQPAVPPSVGTCSANAINSSNVVCGTRTLDGQTQKTTAFIWTAQNGFTDLGLINEQSTSAADINDQSAVTGWMIVNNLQHPFLWNGAALTDIGTLTGIGNGTIPWAMNDEGDVVGQGAVPYSGSLPFVQHPFLYARSTLHELPLLPNHVSGTANDVNNAGLAGGYCRNASGQDTAVLWYQGAISRVADLLVSGSPLIVNSELIAMNDANRLVIGSEMNGSFGTTVLIPEPVSRLILRMTAALAWLTCCW